jgi:glucose-6-phosphate isomerase
MTTATSAPLWQRYRDNLCVAESIGLSLDISRMTFDASFFSRMAPLMQKAYAEMEKLEKGAIANPDEQRMVGHYWLRAPQLAADQKITDEITTTLARIKSFAADVHSGKIAPGSGKFTDLLVIGIGGSALGPQFVADALGDPARDKMRVHFFDNTDPDGIDRVIRSIGDRLASTLSIVISKSGSTPETRNGMILAEAAYKAKGLDFGKHAVAVTGAGSQLDQHAQKQGWITRFPMWDFIGGRTSELAAVGLLPAALQGINIDDMLKGAAACDAVTRKRETKHNPAALLALMWHHATNGKGEKDMVLLPYKDRLLLLSRYLQQLVMESLGKATDLSGNKVEQGIAVYGNKGSTDQHAYVQQLREGVNNFFITFLRVLEDSASTSARTEVEPGVTSGDYLDGFLLGTREALYDNGRQSITITIKRVEPFTVGVLIALFERAVGYYATLVNINAYHQPGVEAGKKAAAAVLKLQGRIVAQLNQGGGTAEAIASAVGEAARVESVYLILEHLAANGRAKKVGSGFDATYSA